MKTSRLIFAIFSLAFCNVAYSQQLLQLKSAKISNFESINPPNRDITYESDGIIVTYNINEALLSETSEQERTYLWKIPGFGTTDIPGNYAMPFRNDAFAIPKGHVATVEITDSAFVDYKSKLAFARRPQKGKNTGSDKTTLHNIPNESINSIPPIVSVSKKINRYRGTDIINVQVCPIQYEQATQTIRAYTLIKYKVKFIPANSTNYISSSNNTHEVILHDDNFLNNITLNGKEHAYTQNITRASAQEDVARDYLIISTNKYATAIA